MICRIVLSVYIPDTEAEVRAALETINRESGLDDSGPTYESMIDPDWEYDPNDPQIKDGFDSSEFAFYVLDNRLVSETAENHIPDLDYECY